MPQFASFDEVFEALARRFDPSKAQGIEARIVVRIQGEGGGTWSLHFTQGKLQVHKDMPETEPDVVVEAHAEDYWALLRGELDPVAAFMQGRLRVQGNPMLLLRLQDLFRLT